MEVWSLLGSWPLRIVSRAVYAVERDGSRSAYVNFPFLRCPIWTPLTLLVVHASGQSGLRVRVDAPDNVGNVI